MTESAQEHTPAYAATPNEYALYVNPLRALFSSLHFDLSLGAYPTVPPPLRILCRTARQHVYSISQNTENLSKSISYTLRLIKLVKTEDLDRNLSAWHELRLQQKFRAYLEQMGGTQLKKPEFPVEARVSILLGYLLSPPQEQRAWVEIPQGWNELEEEYGDVGRTFYETEKVVL